MKLNRILSLILLLKNYPSGLSKKDIITHYLWNHYFDLKEQIKDETMYKNAERMFEEDKKFIKELGFELKLNGYNYLISDIHNSNQKVVLDSNEKKFIAEILLNAIHNAREQNKVSSIYKNIYIKIFMNDEEYLKKLLEEDHIRDVNLSIHRSYFLVDPDKYLIFSSLVYQKKPLRIVYQKKNFEIIERIVYPLFLYYNQFLVYLVSYDYSKKDIRNYLLSSIKEWNQIDFDEQIQKVKIEDFYSKKLNRNMILLNTEEIRDKVPHPLNISEYNFTGERFSIVLKIDKKYKNIYLKYLKNQNRFYIRYKFFNVSEQSIELQIRVKNIQAIFYFLVQYPESILEIYPVDIKMKYKEFIKKSIHFYENTKIKNVDYANTR